METSTSLCLSSPQTLLHNSTNHVTHSSPMENFREFISRLAETRPNNPLTPPSKTLLHARLNQFASEYETPDHPPYSAMIQRALDELNEKKGSSEESISQYLEKRFGNLPWAHSELLKHHLEKLCESNEIIVTRDKRYGLPGRLNLSSEVKKKPGRRKRRWRYNWERERNNRLKTKLRNKKNKRNREKDEEQSFTEENGVCSDDKSEQATKLLSCVVEKEYCEEMFPSAQQEGKPLEENQDELISSAERQHPLEPKTTSPQHENTLEGKHLGMRLRPRRAKTEEQEGKPLEENQDELMASAERQHALEPKKTSPQHENTFEGKHLGMRLRPRRAKVEVFKDENFVPCTSELLEELIKPKPDSANVEDFVESRKRQSDCDSSVCEKTEPPQRRLRFRLSNPKRKVQVRRGRPSKRRAA